MACEKGEHGGWTSTARHEAAYVELPGGAHFVIVTFAQN